MLHHLINNKLSANYQKYICHPDLFLIPSCHNLLSFSNYSRLFVQPTKELIVPPQSLHMSSNNYSAPFSTSNYIHTNLTIVLPSFSMPLSNIHYQPPHIISITSPSLCPLNTYLSYHLHTPFPSKIKHLQNFYLPLFVP